ncbi:hypothetical protein NC652_024324 [Populus alba x Populus x berolinensis]|nr:hypothetical protein NC652_024324 [Populus alba x Populus x berolinensis]
MSKQSLEPFGSIITQGVESIDHGNAVLYNSIHSTIIKQVDIICLWEVQRIFTAKLFSLKIDHCLDIIKLLRSNQNLCLSCRTLAGQGLANTDVHGIGSSITCRPGFFYTCKHTSQRASFFPTGAG